MSRARHTPGPWRVIADPPRTRDRRRMALVATPTGRTAIDCTGSGATYAEDCANARLVAAAPGMLATLEFAEKGLREFSGLRGVQAALRAAIALAREGEAP